MRSKILRLVEWSLLGVGVVGILIYGAARVSARLTQAEAARSLEIATLAVAAEAASSRADEGVRRDDEGARHGSAPATASPTALMGPNPPVAPPRCPSGLESSAAAPGNEVSWRSEMLQVPPPDMSDWAQGRRECHARALAEVDRNAALGRLDIPSIRVSVIVLPGVDAVCLNGGVGHIPGTPRPGEAGNIGIAGHRDGFFRGLERIAKGSVLRLTTPRGAFTYEVQWTKIVEPKDVEVLAGRGADEITLVTCYPFRVLGAAPKRFIVRALCVGGPSAP